METIKKVLVVEDQKYIRVFLERLFTKEFGWAYYQDRNGIEGLKVYEEIRPDIILLDVSMPDLNGLEFIKVLRNSKKDYSTPVIIISANSNKDLIERFAEFNITDYILKPFTYQGLKERINNILHNL